MSTPSITDLLDMKSQPRQGQPLEAAQVQAHLSRLDGWQLHEGAIQKSFAFDDYHRTLAFVNALAWIAHQEDHHPDLSVTYARCTVRFSTHSVGGLSVNDFICAAKTDALGARGG